MQPRGDSPFLLVFVRAGSHTGGKLIVSTKYYIYSVRSETSVPERYRDNSTVRYERISRKAVPGKSGLFARSMILQLEDTLQYY